MVYGFHEDHSGGYSTSFQWMDGDAKKVELVDTTLDGAPGLVKAHFISTFGAGRAVKSEFVATKLKGHQNVIDYDFNEGTGGGFLVSQAFKDIVESFEPNVHQFFDVEVFAKSGVFLKNMYLMFICQRLDTIDADSTTYEFVNNLAWMNRDYAQPGRKKLVFSSEKIGKHHMWVEKYMIAESKIMSNALRDAIIKADLKGIGFERMEEV